MQADNRPLFMQEEGALSSKFSAVQLATPPKGSVQKKQADTVDGPHVSSTVDIQDDEKGEVVANTNSSVTVDSNTVAEALVSLYCSAHIIGHCVPTIREY